MQKESKRRIFVVDDERVIADTLAIILCQAGFEAISLHSGREALDAAMQYPPDLAICDIVMPDISGVDLAISLSSQFPNCRILMLSAQISTYEILKPAEERGYHFEVLSKPVSPNELLTKIRQLDEAYPFGTPG